MLVTLEEAKMIRELILHSASALLLLFGGTLVPARSGVTEFHSLRVKAPEQIRANANRTPAGTLRNGILTIRLELRTGRWYPEADGGPSLDVEAFGEVGKPLQIPGPLIRVRQGTEIRASIRNTLSDSALILYGFHTRPGSADDTIQIAAGTTRHVRFAAGQPGTYFYWGNTTSAKPGEKRDGVDSQLTGAMIVDPSGGPLPDDRVFVLGAFLQPVDSSGPTPTPLETMVINGRSWPHTERLTFTQGDSVHWCWINPTAIAHPMHLHGFYFRVDSRGTWAADTVYSPAEQRLAVTELMLPGATNTFRWVPERVGNWLFHCHFSFHVSHHLILPERHSGPLLPEAQPIDHSQHRMAGLVLGLHVLANCAAKPTATTTAAPRKLRLLIQSAPNRYGKEPGMGFVLHENGAEPARDSVPPAGPTIVLRRGQPVAITVVNRLNEPAAVHWHGIELESFPDGVPGWSGTPARIMPPIAPRDSFVAEFVPPRSGTFIYHSHTNELAQIGSGMYGALLVVDSGQTLDPQIDRVILVGGAGPRFDGLVNGMREPPPLDLEVGRTYRLRLININVDWRIAFSLATDTGYARWRPVAKDGADLPPHQARLMPAYLLTGPGETNDFEFTPIEPGNLRLNITTQLTGWHVPVAVRVRKSG